MKTASAGWVSHLGQPAPQALVMAACWKVRRKDGVKLGFTEAIGDFSFDLGDGDGSVTYKAETGLTRSALETEASMRVDSMEAQGAAGSGILSSSEITVEDLKAGRYDNAEVKAFYVRPDVLSDGPLRLNVFYIGSVERRGEFFAAQLSSFTAPYNQAVGKVVQPTCRADLYDPADCKVAPAGFTSSVTITSVTSRREFVTDYGGSDTWFEFGTAVFTSGDNNGLTEQIKTWTLGTKTVKLYLPMPFDLANGVTLDLRAGCDKLKSTCITRFNNVLNFRGEAEVPGNDLLFRIPDAG